MRSVACLPSIAGYPTYRRRCYVVLILGGSLFVVTGHQFGRTVLIADAGRPARLPVVALAVACLVGWFALPLATPNALPLTPPPLRPQRDYCLILPGTPCCPVWCLCRAPRLAVRLFALVVNPRPAAAPLGSFRYCFAYPRATVGWFGCCGSRLATACVAALPAAVRMPCRRILALLTRWCRA